jgi:mannose-6-phosphate isomerase
VNRLLLPLDNPVKSYAWGSRTSLAGIRGVTAPSTSPEAELWMGAHPSAPSLVESNGVAGSLAEAIRARPEPMLGARVLAAYGVRLPFLLKILAAAEPLSLQAHPSAERARYGFDHENSRGVPLDAPQRSYKDPHHKPELICALSPFHALVGFRPIAETRRLLESLAAPALVPLVEALSLVPAERALRTFFGLAVSSSPDFRREIAEATLEACRRQVGQAGGFSRELAWGVRIGELHPGDPGILVALALNLVVLAPGEALFLPAGNLHAYLEGTGVEIMASSDNVLRGGLTTKHVDVPELLDVLDFRAAPASLVPTTTNGSEVSYLTPAPEFALSRIALHGDEATVGPVTGPEILLVTEGSVTVTRGGDTATLAGGASVFVPAEGRALFLRGSGTVFRARVNDSSAARAP